MFTTTHLLVFILICVLFGAYCANEKRWEWVVACIVGIFLCGMALYFRMLGMM